MYIDPKSDIAGHPSLAVRKLMRRGSGLWTHDFVEDVLGVSSDEAREIVKRLAAEGYVEPEPDLEEYWKTTELGNRLALASAARPIKRSTADRIVDELLDRVLEVNRDEHYLYKVTKVDVFGSYLSDRDRINDIDLAVTLEAKESDPERRLELNMQRAADASDDGKRFKRYIDRVFWAQHEVKLYLKSRSRAISLHAPGELAKLNTRSEVLFVDD